VPQVSHKFRSLLAVTLLLGAVLLFCFQPMVGKMILPFLGGATSVWTTAVLFFQVMLLAGYVYADRLTRVRSQRTQVILHILLMAVAVFFLPVRFTGESFGSETFSHPALWEFLILLRTAGIPYLMVATTAPLLQSWFSRADDASARDPYHLYAVSNLGSLLGLLVYPFLLEPTTGARQQSLYWMAGYVVLIPMSAMVGVLALKRPSRFLNPSERPASSDVNPKTRLYWIAASLVPSGLMLAVTTHISVNLVPMPLVWTLPLAVYLVTFIVAFGRRIRLSSERVAQLSLPVLILL
jgi:hypothetical protein